MSLPLQENMNMDDPEEHFLWALLSMGSEQLAPMIVPPQMLRVWSRHLYRCGFRHQPQLQEIFYQPPHENASAFEAVTGKWAETPPEATSEVDQVIEGLPAEVIERIVEKHGGKHE